MPYVSLQCGMHTECSLFFCAAEWLIQNNSRQRKINLFVEECLLKKDKEIRKALFGLDCVAKHISVRDGFISNVVYNKKQFFLMLLG